MVTKVEHYAAHHAGGFTVVGKGRTAWSDHKPHPPTVSGACLKNTSILTTLNNKPKHVLTLQIRYFGDFRLSVGGCVCVCVCISVGI